uniref:Uncharacterized protein n=1 Tax=Hyaloperonospora arabidopsidis (strain Emoy2) TaxID=559515 RepID=M4BGJ8_HYAAE
MGNKCRHLRSLINSRSLKKSLEGSVQWHLEPSRCVHQSPVTGSETVTGSNRNVRLEST